MWHLESEKPDIFESVLIITEKQYMIEAFWNGKAWLTPHDQSEIECIYWRALPGTNLKCRKSKKKSTCLVQCDDLVEETNEDILKEQQHVIVKPKNLRRLTKVKYDSNGKMCVKRKKRKL